MVPFFLLVTSMVTAGGSDGHKPTSSPEPLIRSCNPIVSTNWTQKPLNLKLVQLVEPGCSKNWQFLLERVCFSLRER